MCITAMDIDKLCRRFVPTFHPLSLVFFATATVVAFVLLCSSRFGFHCHTWCEAMPTQKSAWKWLCNLSQLLVWKIAKGIHLRKPGSLNRLIDSRSQSFCSASKLLKCSESKGLRCMHLPFSFFFIIIFSCWLHCALFQRITVHVVWYKKL